MTTTNMLTMNVAMLGTSLRPIMIMGLYIFFNKVIPVDHDFLDVRLRTEHDVRLRTEY